MKLESKYNIGDKVFHILSTSDMIEVDCPKCAGTGRIDLKDGTDYKCPGNCYLGKKREYIGQKWIVGIGRLTIGQIRLEIEKDDIKESYMALETGVGSGTIHNIEFLYSTKEEAQKECDRRNYENFMSEVGDKKKDI